jgi:hypothetical protein
LEIAKQLNLLRKEQFGESEQLGRFKETAYDITNSRLLVVGCLND